MNSVLWILVRIALLVIFSASFARMTSGTNVFPLDAGDVIFLLFAFIFPAWRFSSILRCRFEKKKPQDDWSASLWRSPLLKNPESFYLLAGLAFVAGSVLGLLITRPAA